MKNFLENVKRFHKDEDGLPLAEIALMVLALIVIVGGYMFIKPRIQENFSKAGSELDKVNNESY